MTTRDEKTAICFLPATELALRIRRRDLSPVEVVEAYLSRIEERNPVINAYTLVLAEQALEAARAAEKAVMSGAPLGRLHGVPVGIKDMDDVKGVESSLGSLAFKGYVPKSNTAFIDRLLADGAIILGKTNTPEYGHKGTTDNLRFGPTSTPWKTGYNAGGSSGGSAAAVADGMAALAQGTDGGGSVRIPAALTGTVGFKPSFGRIPSVTRPDGFLWGHPFVHLGPLARTVADAALMTQVTAGPHSRDPLSLPADPSLDFVAASRAPAQKLRVAYSPRLGNFPVDPQVAAVVKAAVDKLSAQGIEVEEVELPLAIDSQELAHLWVRTISIHYGAIAEQLKSTGMDLLGDHAEQLTPEFRAMLESAGAYSAVSHVLDDLMRTEIFDALENVLDRFDLIVSPTLATPSIKNATNRNTVGPVSIHGQTVEPLIGWCMTYLLNFTGHPAASVPAGLTPDGFPIGMQIIGKRHADASVLTMAGFFEQIQPWFNSYPGLSKLPTA